MSDQRSGLAMRRALMVGDSVPKARRSWIGFESGRELVAPGLYVHSISTQPQVLFRGDLLCVDPVCAPHFWLHDVLVGNISQGVSRIPVRCTLFPPLTYVGMRPDRCTEHEDCCEVPELGRACWLSRFTDEEKIWLENQTRQYYDNADISQFITLRIENRSQERQAFSAIMWGRILT